MQNNVAGFIAAKGPQNSGNYMNVKVPVIAIDRIVAGNDLIAFGTIRRGRNCQILW